ncbi:MAG: class I SAM-dependent methyltransferase [Pseudomonadota bacterium]
MSNDEQREYWNGIAGKQWVDQDNTLQRLLQPAADLLLREPRVPDARKALNVGCGGGGETLMLSRALNPQATVTGVDISEPLIALARQRVDAEPALAGRVSFHCTDASAGDLGAPDYDLVFSRFGVMFFDDPIGAFAHIRAHVASDGSLVFACWQQLADNPWVTVPLTAALTVLPPPEIPPPGSPGPFAFADGDRTRSLLEQSGWTNVKVRAESIDLRWNVASNGTALAQEILKIGPVSRMLQAAPESEHPRVYEAVAEALLPHIENDTLTLSGAIWIVSATNC